MRRPSLGPPFRIDAQECVERAPGRRPAERAGGVFADARVEQIAACLQLLAELEAGLDFVDEDIEFVSRNEILDRLSAAQLALRDVAARLVGRATPLCPRVVLTGPPNAGKSSLFNALAARLAVDRGRPGGGATAALVSPIRGTTRDYLTAHLCIGGVEIELVDTAGVDAATGSDVVAGQPTTLAGDINRSAQTAAISQRTAAPFRIWCYDATLPRQVLATLETEANFDSRRDLSYEGGAASS